MAAAGLRCSLHDAPPPCCTCCYLHPFLIAPGPPPPHPCLHLATHAGLPHLQGGHARHQPGVLPPHRVAGGELEPCVQPAGRQRGHEVVKGARGVEMRMPGHSIFDTRAVSHAVRRPSRASLGMGRPRRRLCTVCATTVPRRCVARLWGHHAPGSHGMRSAHSVVVASCRPAGATARVALALPAPLLDTCRSTTSTCATSTRWPCSSA